MPEYNLIDTLKIAGKTLINSKLEHKSGKLWNNNCLKITLLKFFSTIDGIFLFLFILEPSSPVGVSLYPYSIIFSSLFILYSDY